MTAPIETPRPGLTKREPALIIGAITALVTAGLNVAIVFGLGLTAEQAAALAGLTLPVAGLVQAIVTRQSVVSPATAEVIEAEAYDAGVGDSTPEAVVEDDQAELEYEPRRALLEP